jgi:PPM family protein phosphatase
MKYQLASYSFRGGRPTNQDRVAVAERDNAVILVVADGLGGHAGGEIAAEILTQTMLRAFQGVKQPVIARPSAFLALSILQAHTAIHQYTRTQPPHMQPRTTCVTCLVQNGYAYWAHVGDSRLYHFRDDRLLRRTQDHTPVEQLHQEGLLSDDEMGDHPSKGRLLKCVGGPNKPTIALGQETVLLQNDTLLLCSDGVWEALSAEDIGRYATYADLDEGVEEMLRCVEKRTAGTSDNITAAALRWDDVMTSSLPLQGNEAVQVDPKQLWEDGTKWSADLKLQSQNPPKDAPQSLDSIEDQIREIEQYMRKHEPRH